MDSTLTLLVDFGLVVLIWLVQIIVYPSFLTVAEKDFVAWHARYTARISWLVVPLMFAQLALHAQGLLEAPTGTRVLGGVLTGGAWIATFALSVPCHRALAERGKSVEVIRRLIRTNWVRTVLWTAVFALSTLSSLGL